LLYRAPCVSLDPQKLVEQRLHARVCDRTNASDVLIGLTRELLSSDPSRRVVDECLHALRREWVSVIL
jgi:hypothetical protein